MQNIYVNSIPWNIMMTVDESQMINIFTTDVDTNVHNVGAICSLVDEINFERNMHICS